MGPHSCSTFLLQTGATLLAAHNLDDDIEVPGLVVVNPRGTKKHNLSWEALRVGPFIKEPRIEWVSKFASLTYNPLGKEFPDGGLNETGLYVGEMTLFGTRYPADPALPKFYHHHWIQYLLDNFATVDEVLESLEKVQISGHCLWHFFVADQQGDRAIIEFPDGKPIVHTGKQMPYPVLCNRSYENDMAHMKQFTQFGGNNPLVFDNYEGDPRFAWAVHMLSQAPEPGMGPVERAFAILKQLYCGNNKWSIVCDLPAKRMYFQTDHTRTVCHVALSSFDLSPAAPAMLLDIHSPLEGDVVGFFAPYTEKQNHAVLSQFLDAINWGGFVLNKIWMPIFRHNLREAVRSVQKEDG
jgi:penicillin V acylase-like amidase (Ntn superfamily)